MIDLRSSVPLARARHDVRRASRARFSLALGVAATLLVLACGKTEHRPELAHQLPTPESVVPAPESATSSDAASASPAPLDRNVRPAARAMSTLKVPSPEHFRLDNGLEVYLLTTATLPTVTMTFEFDVGAVGDPPDQLGLASVCLDLYSEGTARLDKVAWAEALADHALTIHSPAGLETSSIVLRGLTSELEPALDLLTELLTSPGMRQADFDRIIADRKAALTQSRGTSAGVAGRLFGSLVWGAEHPYGQVQLEAHLEALTLQACKDWVARLRPAGARLWVAGKITREALVAALGKRLATWVGSAPSPIAIAAAPAPAGAIHAVQIDGAVQSMVLVGHPGPPRGAADYEPTHLMAQIFGGGFSSRINMNLREAKGYAYGSSGRFSYRRGGSQLAISASVESSTTVLALREIAMEIKKMHDAEVSPAELSRERDGALLALPARFAQPGDALAELRSLLFFGLPFDWFAGYQTRLTAVDLAAIRVAAKSHLAPGAVTVLVAGDLTKPAKDAGGKSIREELQQLADEQVFGPGGLVFLDADGKRL